MPPLVWGTSTPFRGSWFIQRRVGRLAKSMPEAFRAQLRTGPNNDNNMLMLVF